MDGCSYLRNYAKTYNVKNVNSFVSKCLRDAEQTQDLIEAITTQNYDLGTYFIPYHPEEYRREVTPSLRKGKHSGLRIYAIKVYDNCYVITSGAIKMSQTTQEHPDTNNAVKRLKKSQNYLMNEGIVDDNSFYELLNELE